MATELQKLQNDADLFIQGKEDTIQVITEEMELVKVEHELESGLKEFQLKLDEFKKMTQLKDEALKNVGKCGKEVTNVYKNLVYSIPESPSDDYMDFSALEKQIQPLKTEAERTFQGN